MNNAACSSPFVLTLQITHTFLGNYHVHIPKENPDCAIRQNGHESRLGSVKLRFRIQKHNIEVSGGMRKFFMPCIEVVYIANAYKICTLFGTLVSVSTKDEKTLHT